MPKISDKLEMSIAYHALNHIGEIVYWLDKNGKVLYVNNAFCKKLGYEKEEAKGQAANFFLPRFKMVSYNKELKTLTKKGSIEKEELVKAKNEKLIPVERWSSLFNEGKLQVYCGVMRDISKRKKLEAQRELRLEHIEKLKNQLEEENDVLKEEIELKHRHQNIITNSDKYKEVLAHAQQVAPTDSTVLITGETGTGKELVTHMIYSLSKRSEKSLVKVNCAALPESLIESELFGHEKGAFTGANFQKKGRFEVAHKGTIFLDEIGDLPLALQAKLLRVLQSGEFNRIGSTETIRIDSRVIAATNRDLGQMVKQGKFREDLFYRLNVFPIHNLPLRERPEDIPLLISHFIDKYTKGTQKKITSIPASAVKALQKYDFPGNIRELENIVERAVILSTGSKLRLHSAFQPANKRSDSRNKSFKTLEQMQRSHILEALKKCKWKVSGKGGAAELLAINPKTLWSRMDKLGISTN